MVDKTLMTAAEFLELPESLTPTELIHGEIIVSPAPNPNHQFIVGEIYTLVRALSTGGKVLLAPIDVYLDDDNVTQPDVLWIAPDGKCKVERKFLRGAPDLVVEVLSDRTKKLDRGDKFDLYQKHGVREYWIVDPENHTAEIWVRDGEKFAQSGIFGMEDTFTSPLLGKPVSVRQMFP